MHIMNNTGCNGGLMGDNMQRDTQQAIQSIRALLSHPGPLVGKQLSSCHPLQPVFPYFAHI